MSKELGIYAPYTDHTRFVNFLNHKLEGWQVSILGPLATFPEVHYDAVVACADLKDNTPSIPDPIPSMISAACKIKLPHGVIAPEFPNYLADEIKQYSVNCGLIEMDTRIGILTLQRQLTSENGLEKWLPSRKYRA
jgi:hypothetical protein